MKAVIFFLVALIPVLVSGQLPCTPSSSRGVLSALVNGHSVVLRDDTAQRNCGSRYSMGIRSISSDTLIWMQTDSAGGALCNCPFNLSVGVDSLKTGNYITRVFATDTYYHDTCYVGSVSFTITEPFSYFSPFAENPYQSICLLEGIRSDQSSTTALKIFPNPTDGILTIITNLKGSKVITISDMENKRIIEFNTEAEVNTIDLGALSKAMYFVTVRNHDKSVHAKVCKN